MKYSTIQVTPRMRRRLAGYKRGGMSYEDVLEVLTDALPVAEFRKRHERAHAAANALLRTPSPTRAAEAGRATEEARLRALSPFERMEEAYRLFETLRGVS